MSALCYKGSTVHLLFEISSSQNTKFAKMVSFPSPGHMYVFGIIALLVQSHYFGS